jgi:hypothetical protein
MVKTADKIEEEIRAIFSGDTPWVTIVWDDPVIRLLQSACNRIDVASS